MSRKSVQQNITQQIEAFQGTGAPGVNSVAALRAVNDSYLKLLKLINKKKRQKEKTLYLHKLLQSRKITFSAFQNITGLIIDKPNKEITKSTQSFQADMRRTNFLPLNKNELQKFKDTWDDSIATDPDYVQHKMNPEFFANVCESYVRQHAEKDPFNLPRYDVLAQVTFNYFDKNDVLCGINICFDPKHEELTGVFLSRKLNKSTDEIELFYYGNTPEQLAIFKNDINRPGLQNLLFNDFTYKITDEQNKLNSKSIKHWQESFTRAEEGNINPNVFQYKPAYLKMAGMFLVASSDYLAYGCCISVGICLGVAAAAIVFPLNPVTVIAGIATGAILGAAAWKCAKTAASGVTNCMSAFFNRCCGSTEKQPTRAAKPETAQPETTEVDTSGTDTDLGYATDPVCP